MILHTNRLLLRPWNEDDAAALYRYASDPAVALPSGWFPHRDVENSREIIRTILQKPTVFAVCLHDGVPIGNIHLDFETALRTQSGECELGFWLGRPFWGRGIILEAGCAMLDCAFSVYGAPGVWCGYFDGNDKSRRVQEKLGFVRRRTDTVVDFCAPMQTKSVHRTYLTREQWENDHDTGNKARIAPSVE